MVYSDRSSGGISFSCGKAVPVYAERMTAISPISILLTVIPLSGNYELLVL